MAEPMWRPLALPDAPRMAALLAACEAADGAGAGGDADDVREALGAPGMDLAAGTTSAWYGDGLVAYATTRTREQADSVHQLTLDIAVRPGYRTAGMLRRLLEWSRATGARRHQDLYGEHPLELHTRTHHGQAWLAEALDTAGHRRERTYVGMKLDLAGEHQPVGPPELPSGTRIVPFDDRYDAMLLRARNEIFADNWGSVAMTARTWRHSVTGSRYFRPESSFLLLPERREEILCYLLCTELAGTSTDREVYLANAGTQPALHGRGLYRAVFTHTLARAKAQGYRCAVLDVDSTNPMAAGGFYERMGFRTFRTWTTHVLAGGPPA
ncbi:GNAT family N-acetyltransferase [Streptomyces sp. NPDC001930]|uniref:GNAT family N-acetyltransferase n=1 Tax=Streptomyces sp. NPDC001930 TaxID=3364625 RepID=UPI0036CA2565